MKNLTIALDEKILKASRDYAKQRGLSLNNLIRQLLSKTVLPQKTDWLEECFELMDQAKANSKGQRWSRNDIYDV